MLIYESGMTEEEFIACLMEAGAGRYRLNIALKLDLGELPKVDRYCAVIQAHSAKRGLRPFVQTAGADLHLSLIQRIWGTDTMRSNLYQDFKRLPDRITLPYLDTNSTEKSGTDRSFLWIEFNQTPELAKLREGILSAMHTYRVSESPGFNYNPHMTIGNDIQDTPDESVTADPGFTEMTFKGFRIAIV